MLGITDPQRLTERSAFGGYWRKVGTISIRIKDDFIVQAIDHRLSGIVWSAEPVQ